MAAPKTFGARVKARRVKITKWWRSPRMVNFRHRYGAAVTVFGVAFYVSYGHIHEVTLRAGETAVVAALMPLQVDALMLVGGLYIDHAKTRAGKFYAWGSFVTGFLASLSANYLATEPTILGKGVGIMTALALLWAAGTVHWGSKKAKPRPRQAPQPVAQTTPAVALVERNGARFSEDDLGLLGVAYGSA